MIMFGIQTEKLFFCGSLIQFNFVLFCNIETTRTMISLCDIFARTGSAKDMSYEKSRKAFLHGMYGHNYKKFMDLIMS